MGNDMPDKEKWTPGDIALAIFVMAVMLIAIYAMTVMATNMFIMGAR